MMEALENVIDPELGLDFVSLGLVYDVEIEDRDVHITFTLTTPACPIGPQVTEALSNVIDPELGLDFVELGLVYGVEIDGGTVTVTFTLTTPACPIGPQVSEHMQEFVGDI